MSNIVEVNYSSKAIHNLAPNANWSLTDNILTWGVDNTQTQPTNAEIDAEVIRLQAEYDAKQYARDRASAYPPITDQLDTIYHEGIDAWKAVITAVKEEYPKP